MMARSTECEVRQGAGGWAVVTAERAVELGTDTEKRCVECHGLVRAHKATDCGVAHIEHMQGNPGCTLGMNYDGNGRRRHVHPLD